MSVVTRPPGERAVARPSWVRRQDSQHEGIVAGIMLTLVIVGIVVFLFWGQMLRLVASSPLFHVPSPPQERPAEGAAPPGPPVVVTLDSPVLPQRPAQDVATPDQLTVLDPAAAGASISADAPGADTASADTSANPVTEADAAAEVAASHDAAETARVAEEARAAEESRAASIARAAATPAPTAGPAATATRPALTPTPAATPRATASATANSTAGGSANTAAGAAATGKRARVVRTGGRGVVMYSAPRQGARLPAGFPEGSVVSVLSAAGEWSQVQANGQTGWVKSEFLAPAE